LNAVSALPNLDFNWSNFGQLIEDTKVRIYSLQTSDVQYFRREANKAAHRMVKAALINSLKKKKKKKEEEETSSFK
jgi:hypothetical protein